jgi:hypothetical protein
MRCDAAFLLIYYLAKKQHRDKLHKIYFGITRAYILLTNRYIVIEIFTLYVGRQSGYDLGLPSLLSTTFLLVCHLNPETE